MGKQGKEEMINEIRDLIVRYIGTNKHLEEINIGNLTGYGFERIEYKRWQEKKDD